MVLGHERDGIPDEAMELVDVAVGIAMAGRGASCAGTSFRDPRRPGPRPGRPGRPVAERPGAQRSRAICSMSSIDVTGVIASICRCRNRTASRPTVAGSSMMRPSAASSR
jgi:hypothetical protein